MKESVHFEASSPQDAEQVPPPKTSAPTGRRKEGIFDGIYLVCKQCGYEGDVLQDLVHNCKASMSKHYCNECSVIRGAHGKCKYYTALYLQQNATGPLKQTQLPDSSQSSDSDWDDEHQRPWDL